MRRAARVSDETEKENIGKQAEEALKKSEAAFRAALNPKRKVLRAYEGLGNIYFHQGDYQAAALNFKTETIINHRAVHAFAGLGNSQYKLKDFAAAAKAYQTAIGIKSNIGYIHAGLGASLLALKQPDQAIDSYLRATELSPRSKYIYPQLGQLLLDHARQDEVFAAMQRWIGVNPKTPRPYIFIGKAHLANEDIAAASAAFQTAIIRAPDPDNKHHKTAQAQLNLIKSRQDLTE